MNLRMVFFSALAPDDDCLSSDTLIPGGDLSQQPKADMGKATTIHKKMTACKEVIQVCDEILIKNEAHLPLNDPVSPLDLTT
ncbi:hypothetical protein AMTR_s00010p00037760 [Amborella trichopoda]|uniref:Uncharacterized protein n=1 Tax=Amborella trichopoda TaxID=13333 RepID=W1NE35_AMBTC|nr:hypothetical protein AMTR_s00010p00037760 [Amborella trichopoda]